MAFTTTGLDREDQDVIVSLANAIPRAMRSAANYIRADQYLSMQWFGDNDICWIFELKRKLIRMATIIETYPFNVSWETNESNYEKYDALAYKPESGWRDNTISYNYADLFQPGMTISGISTETTPFKITLGGGWHERPLFKNISQMDSQFQTMVHELSHLLMNTIDFVEGYNTCLTYAVNNCQFAKGNADNWGYFVEEFRLMNYLL